VTTANRLSKFLKSSYPDIKLKESGRKSWYKFPKSNSLLYIIGVGYTGNYLDKNDYDFLIDLDKSYLALVHREPSNTLVIPKEKVKEIFQAQPVSKHTSKSPRFTFTVIIRSGQHILEFFESRSEFNIESYLNNWKQISDFQNTQPIGGSKSIIGIPSEIFQSVRLTAYPNTNLESSKRITILGWKQKPSDLIEGDYVFVFDITKDVINSCFELI
jgi:hypothetical protein